MKCIHIVGRKNHGKTRLMVELIEELLGRGIRVGSIKYSPHAHEIETPGKDSHRHRSAGAAPAAVVTGDLIAVFQPRGEIDFYRHLAPFYADCDLVLVEGDVDGPGTKLEVWRREVGGGCLARDHGDIAAVISDDQPEVDLPVWPRSHVSSLADRLMEHLSALAKGRFKTHIP